MVTSSAGWIDKTPRGRLRFDGRDAASFLHALVTNDVERLESGQGVYALYLTPQGRMISDLRIYRRGDHLLADVPAGLAGPLAARFDQVIFSEDVRVADASGEIGEIAVIGPSAADLLSARVGVDSGVLRALPVWSHVAIAGGFIARTDDTELESFDVFAPAPVLSGAPISAALFDVFRIEAGRPAFGVDMTEETIPLEAGLVDRAMSLTKGCYVGQEVIVRVLHRGGGRVARLLVALDFDESATEPPRAGTPIIAYGVDGVDGVDGQEVGRVTSSAWSPGRRRSIALGYVRRELAEVGRRVSAAGAPAAIVRVPRPF